MHAVVAEVFTHRATSKWCQELQRSGVRRSRSNDDRVLQSATLFQNLHELGNCRTLLANRDVDAIELFSIRTIVMDGLLIKEGVKNDRCLACLTVTDDQLALTTANRDQSVDSLEACRHWLVNRLAWNNTGSLNVNARTACCVDWALAVNRVTESVDNAAEKLWTNRNVHDGTSPLDCVAFFDAAVRTENNNTDVVSFKVQGHPADTARELDHFTGLDIVQTIDAGNTVTDGKHLADFRDFCLFAKVFNLIFKNCGNFRGADIHQPTSFSASLRVESLVRSDVSIWREPTLTIRPPRIVESTLTFTVTSLPVTLLSAAFNS